MKTLILIGLFLYTTFAIGECSAPSPSERAGVRLLPSVAQARAMLASIYFHPEEYDDDCFGEGKRMANTTDNEEGVTMLDDAVSFVNVFPNPNNGTFTINYNLVNVVTATILVEDITGKLIYSMGLDVSTNTLNLNLMDIVNGIYFVKIKNKDAIISVNKVIINN
jgi:hypothetical protein